MDKKKKTYVGVVAVIFVIAALALNSQSNPLLLQSVNQPVLPSQMSALQSIANNQSLADNIGMGVISQTTFPSKILGSPLVQDSKPVMLYMGAEYCPYCAATRWAMVIALMRFGDLSGLKYMTSSATDYSASTPTFTFANSSYSSRYITFISVELENNTGAPLQTPAKWENTSLYKYDPPTATCPSGGCIPFIDFGNKTVQLGADYSPILIQHYTWAQIIGMLNDTSSPVSQSIIGGADVFTAQICAIDNFTPSSVCSAPYIKSVINES
jgi:thiol-disulfide isomerase/thioredoxin